MAGGPQDHCYTVTLSDYTNGAHPNATIDLKLGSDSAQQAPYPTAFFDEATTDYQGLCPGTVSGGGVCTPASGAIGAQTGSITFTITTNIIGVSSLNANGQPNQCGATGTAQLGVTGLPIYAAVTAASALGQWPTVDPAEPAWHAAAGHGHRLDGRGHRAQPVRLLAGA